MAKRKKPDGAQQVRDIVRERLTDLNWTQRDLHYKCGVPEPILSRWLNGHRDLSSMKLMAVLQALDLHIVLT